MSNRRSGLQYDKILERFFTEATTRQNFATQSYVNTQINSKFNPVPIVDINITNSGVSIFGVSGTNKTVVDIGLCTTLGDLTDVKFTTIPIDGNYLVYNGTSWDVGNGVSTFSITDLTNWSGNLTPNGFLRVNANGTSIAATTTNVVSNVLSGQGITVKNTNTDGTVQRVSLDAGGVFTTTVDRSDNTFVIANSSLETSRIRKDRIALSSFNTQNFVRQTDITAHVDPTGASQGILKAVPYSIKGVSIVLDTTDIMIGVCGVLPISKGGTGSGTSKRARENLGLVISTSGTSSPDVVGYKQGEYLRLTGDNMKLTPSGVPNPTPSLINGFGGTGYTNGTCPRSISGLASHNNQVFVTATASGGSITTVSGVCVFPYITTSGNYFLQDIDGGGSGASIRIDLDYSYLTFGARPNIPHADLDTYLGIRYNTDYNQLEFKGTSPGVSTGWNLLTNKFGVSGLTDVSVASYPYNPNSILIYDNGTSTWRPQVVSGQATISNTGGLSIQNFHASDINLGTGVSRILDTEMLQLSGIKTSETIQDQLDRKIQVNANLIAGDIIRFDETLSGVSNFTKVLNASGVDTTYTYLKQYGVGSGSSIPLYENLYHGFKVLNSGNLENPGYNFCYTNSVTSKAESASLQKTNEYLIGKYVSGGTCPGIDINTSTHTLELNFNTLNTTTTLNDTDILAVQQPVSLGISQPQQISVSNFISGLPAGSGISGSGGQLQVAVDTFSSVSSAAAAGNNYDGRLAYFYGNTTLGPSILGVYYGNSWYGTCMTAFS